MEVSGTSSPPFSRGFSPPATGGQPGVQRGHRTQAVAVRNGHRRPLAFLVGLGSTDHHPDAFGIPPEALDADCDQLRAPERAGETDGKHRARPHGTQLLTGAACRAAPRRRPRLFAPAARHGTVGCRPSPRRWSRRRRRAAVCSATIRMVAALPRLKCSQECADCLN